MYLSIGDDCNPVSLGRSWNTQHSPEEDGNRKEDGENAGRQQDIEDHDKVAQQVCTWHQSLHDRNHQSHVAWHLRMKVLLSRLQGFYLIFEPQNTSTHQVKKCAQYNVLCNCVMLPCSSYNAINRLQWELSNVEKCRILFHIEILQPYDSISEMTEANNKSFALSLRTTADEDWWYSVCTWCQQVRVTISPIYYSRKKGSGIINYLFWLFFCLKFDVLQKGVQN